MEKVKKYWKEITIVVLCVLCMSTCSKKNSYKRKYKNEKIVVESVYDSAAANIDSVTVLYNMAISENDSLRRTVRDLNNVNKTLEEKLAIYMDQNDKLSRKPVIVKIKEQNQ